MIRFNCSGCGKLIQVADEHAGKRGTCPHCRTAVDIPQGSAAESPAAPEVIVSPAAQLQAAEAPQSNVAAPPVAWYYAISGQRQGPLNEPALAMQIQAGQLPPAIQVWRNGMDTWAPANTLAEFQQAAAAFAPQATQQPGQWGRAGAAAAGAHQFSTFPVAVVILLHYVTLGIFTMIYLNLLHGKMPQIRHDDPSAGKAIGFLFIPFFNIYWVFFTYCRLCDRINEQRRSNGLPDSVPKGLAITMCILMLIPYISMLSWLILTPIFAGIVQSNVNELATRAPASRAY